MFIKTKTPLINANLVPLAFGANSAALLAPARAFGASAHAPALLAAGRNVHSHKQCLNCLKKTSLLQTMAHL